MAITIKRNRKKRRFFKNGQEIAFYTLEKDNIRGIYADIFVLKLLYSTNCSKLAIYKTDFEKFGSQKILSFLRTNFRKKVAEAILNELIYDLMSVSENGKEMVVFS